MTTKPQLGRAIYRATLHRGREQTKIIRESLRRVIEEKPGPQTQALLVTRMALAVGTIEAVFTELDEIGKNAKELEGRYDEQ